MPLAVRVVVLFSLLLAAAAARGAAYYSGASPTVARPLMTCLPGLCGGVKVATTNELSGLLLAAEVYAATDGPVTLRLPLSGTAPAGYRAGILVSNLGSVASVQTLGTVTLRTYLDGALQQTRLVDVTALQAALLASTSEPAQLEFTANQPFNAVEVELGNALALGGGLRVKYAYGVENATNRQVAGYVSRFSDSNGKYDVGGCTAGINNPGRAADLDLTNYATFASIASLGCTELLKVKLEGGAPAGYLAGFVVGGANNLLNADLLGGLTLRTYLNGAAQETATGTALLGLDLLPTGQQFVRFTSRKPFDEVSIERTGTVTALDNMQLYYGTGVAGTPPQQTRSNWDNPAGHFSTASASALCGQCYVDNAGNAADNNLGNYATIQVGAGVANAVTLSLELNGGGLAGNRAGVVLGRSSALDASVLGRMVIRTLDAAGNVLETRSGSSLLTLATLPDGRQSVSFNSTRDFAGVSITMGGVVGLLDTTNVYYAFADNSNGVITINAPAGPLPVVLVGLQAQRARSGGADVSWTTASELKSARFVVERATNPETGFEVAGTVAAAGTSASSRRYTLRDDRAAALAGTLYYRLRQEDQDGTVTYSPTVVLAAAPVAEQFSLYPNPSTGHDQVLLAGALPAGASLSVYSLRGQLLRQQPATPASEAAPALPTAGLTPGLYQVVLHGAEGQLLGACRLHITE